jgi:myo-inositol-1(or 4)-monophosphatase
MTAAELQDLRKGAEEAARRGGEVLRQRFTGPRVIALKGSIDLAIAPGPRWYIDPLDGTTNYAHGVPHFCVSVAVWLDDQPLAGAVYHPLLDDLYSAGYQAGAELNGEKIGVSRCASLGEALVATGFPYDIWAKPEAPLRLFAAALGKARGLRRFGAAALDLAYVAAGRFDGYFELGLFPWDVAAGILLVQEAGGLVTNFSGKPPQLDDRQILATNRRIHAELRTVLGA